ncbi:MAG: MotA/TolQ/ExbB proton channel family protein [Bacillota bacterium]|nr:MotA/TolQ/ExbB proton channel family protein [Bacillota bacterium]
MLSALSVPIGIIIAFGGLLAAYSIEKGSVASLILLSPFLTVFVGTWGAVIASFGINNTLAAFKAFIGIFSKKNRPDPDVLIKKLSQISARCRQDGILKLEEMLKDNDIASDKYLLLKEGMLLVMGIKDMDRIESILETDIDAYTSKKQEQIEVFQGAGGFSPTLGVIGTVMGLVQVLSHMSNAEELTASIAVAFIATLYGVVFANLIYLPIANQLKNDLKHQKMYKHIIITGILLIASGETPRNLENQLSLYYQAFPGFEKKYKEGINN